MKKSDSTPEILLNHKKILKKCLIQDKRNNMDIPRKQTPSLRFKVAPFLCAFSGSLKSENVGSKVLKFPVLHKNDLK
jgi:hypothetical protein